MKHPMLRAEEDVGDVKHPMRRAEEDIIWDVGVPTPTKREELTKSELVTDLP